MSLAHERARALYEARRTGEPIAPFTDEDPSLGMAEGYEIQQELVSMLEADGDRVVGHKVGLTSAPMQRLLGVDSPDHGPVLSSVLYPDGATVALGDFVAPKVEAEVVFTLGERLQGPGVSVEQARAAVADVRAGLEIVDSRIADWRIKLADTVADLASMGAVVLSERRVDPAEVDPRLVGMVLDRDGEVVDTGAGAAALGDPVAVVAWLANTLGENGVCLEPGHVIMTGALHAAVPLAAGQVFTAEFDRLGPVSVKVGPEPGA
ncbi:fumarylacetoacetate hydrolase family protein [Nocardiopsis sp. HNM0947]|uniref:Fumarylacetoacetate hydrolase family protein n=1 Tax=Nocardiopsis coralli TaxID=2772213 RepID=A0ABR9P140_9ACTN|nr:fumarylacetoacetate hydrolase family protein [Nocardiopsis coralli]MBE2997531.1 fumarylacetoacetate hydrolase family protein [Nocardiopsis coralli]